MATTTRVVVLVLALLACYGVSAQSPAPETSAGAPSPTDDGCLVALTNMSDCLTFVEDGSNLTKPDKGCCSELAGLVDSNPICLCQLLGKPEFVGIKINLNKALKLPSVCKVTTPPVSTCSAIGVPVSLSPSNEDSMSPGMAPKGSATSPSNAATSPSNAADVPSPGGSSTAATPSGNENGASGIKASALITFIFGLSTLFVSLVF